MRSVMRTAGLAVGPLCLFAAFALAAPTFAETPATSGAPLLLASAEIPTLADTTADQDAADDAFATPQADAAPADTEATLAALVEERLSSDTLNAEQECLAASIYFEAKGEPLAGQLAVAQTLINRAHSGRFPASLCGVVRQHGQFSFVHDGALPAVPRSSQAWREAVAIAGIARDGLWKDEAPAALFFHASSVSPTWRLTRVARLGNHIFYR